YDGMTYFRRGYHLMLQLKRSDDAIADFTKACELLPNFPNAHSLRVSCLLNAGRWQEALPSCDQLIRLEPRSPDHYRERGTAYRKLGQWDKAQADFEECI